MANEIRTRIQLKYDSLQNWATANTQLLQGEVAIAYLPPKGTGTAPAATNEAVLIKVGPGKFNDLPYVSALAADVYAWAKQSENDFVTNFLALKTTDGTTMQAKLDAVFATDAELASAIADLRKEIPTQFGVMSVAAKINEAITVDNTDAANPKIGLKLNNAGNVVLTQDNDGLAANVALPEVHDGQLLMEMGEGLDGSSATFTANDADNVNFKVSHAVPEGATAGNHDGITTDKFGHVIGVDIYTKDEIDELVQGVKDTKTTVAHGDDYIVVEGPATLTDGAVNAYTVKINENALKTLIGNETTAAMEFKGATATLPENPAKGDMYKVSGSFEVAGDTAKVGDSIVYNGTEWFLIPSGDDIEDTWRPVKVGNNTLETNETLEFVAGDHVEIREAGGKVTIAAEDSTYELKAEALADGAKLLLDGLGADVEDSYVNFKDDNVVNVTYSQVSNEEIITFSHADKNEATYTATSATQTPTAAFGETVSFNIDTVSVDKKGHATAARGTVDITLPALPEEKIYDLSVQDAGDVYIGYGSTVGLTLSHDDTPVYLQGKGAGEENEKGDIDITYESSNSSGSLVETITFDINRVRTSKLYDDTYNAKEKTTTLIFNCGSASDVI